MSTNSSVPHATWPAGHRAALCIVILVDAPTATTGPNEASIGLDYTANGLGRLITVLDDLDVKATFAWSAAGIATYPLSAKRAADSEHEIAPWMTTSEPANPSGEIQRVVDMEPVGAVTGSVEEPVPTSKGVYSWAITGVSGDVPTLVEETTVIPISPYWIDTTWLNPAHPLPPSSFLEAWSLSLATTRTEGGLMTIVLHPHIAGRPGICSQIVRFLDEVIDSGDVWIAPASLLAMWTAQSAT